MIVVHNGNCLEELRKIPSDSVDAIVTDPPYGLSNTSPDKVADALTRWISGEDDYIPAGRGFMGQAWDSFVPPPAVWDECMRVLKPGGHMAVFSGARTQDLMGLSIRLAGFEIRDTLGWVYGSGFPKSMNVPKAIESTLTTGKSNSRSLRETEQNGDGEAYTLTGKNNGIMGETRTYERKEFSPGTDEARQWEGWGTALKPAIEPIILARKPLDGTVANNILTHGVGGLNIDACRVEGTPWKAHKATGLAATKFFTEGEAKVVEKKPHNGGRFPANVLLDESAAEEMDRQSGNRPGAVSNGSKTTEGMNGTGTFKIRAREQKPGYADNGGASRFFPVFKYQAKAPKKERPVIVRDDGTKIQHSTVKPLALMEWLVSLVTPPGGTVLDPFAGSGTTLEACKKNEFNAIGIEVNAEYCELINERLSRCKK